MSAHEEQREMTVVETPGPTVYEAFNELSQYFIGQKSTDTKGAHREEDEEQEAGASGSAERTSEQVGHKRTRSESGDDTEVDNKTSTIGQTLVHRGRSQDSDAFLQAVNQLREAVTDISELGQLLQSVHYNGMMTLEKADTPVISGEAKALMWASNFKRMERTLKETREKIQRKRKTLNERVLANRKTMHKQATLVKSQLLLSYMDVHDLLATFQYPSKVDLNNFLELYAASLRKGLKRTQEDQESLVHFRQTVQNLHTRAMSAKKHGEDELGIPREKQLFFKISNPEERRSYDERLKHRPDKKRSPISVLLARIRRAYISCNLQEDELVSQVTKSISRRKRNMQEQRNLCWQHNLVPAFPCGTFEAFLRNGSKGDPVASGITDFFALPLITTHSVMSTDIQATLHKLPVWSICRVFETEDTAGIVDTCRGLNKIFHLFRRSCEPHLSRDQQKVLSNFETYLKDQDDLFGFGMRATLLAAGAPCHGTVSLNNKSEFLEEPDKLSALSQWLLRSYSVLCILKEHLCAVASLPIHDPYKIDDERYLVDEGIVVVDSLRMYSQAERRRERLTLPHRIELKSEPETASAPQSIVFQFPFGRSKDMNPLDIRLTLYPMLLAKGDANEMSWHTEYSSEFAHFGPPWFEYTRRLRKSILSDRPPFPQVDGASEPDKLPSLYFFLEPVRRALVTLRASVEKEYILHELTSVGTLAFSVDLPPQLPLQWSFQGALSDGLEGSCSVADTQLIALVHPCVVLLLEAAESYQPPGGHLPEDVPKRLDQLLEEGAVVRHHYYINDDVYEATTRARK